MKTKSLRATLVVVVALALTACGEGDELDGSISISGSSTAQPLASRIAGRFATDHPHARISIDGPGTGDGLLLLCDGRVDIATASRQINERERQLCELGGVAWVEVPVALDAIVVATGGGVSVDCLTTGELYALSGPEATHVRTWKGAEPLAQTLGSRRSLPDQPLEVIAPRSQSGTVAVYLDLVIKDMAEQRKKAVAMRTDFVQAETDRFVPQALLTRPTALGVLGFTAAQQDLGPRRVAIDAGQGCVAPDPESVSSGSYPLARTLYFYVNAGRARLNPTLRTFVDVSLSKEAEPLVVEAGAVALSPEAKDKARRAWAAR